jgi:hypothetical protein
MTNSSALIVPSQSAAAPSAAQPSFHDIVKPLIDIPNYWLWLWLLLAAALLALVAWLIWKRVKKSAIFAPPPPIPAHIRALRKLEDALGLISDPKAFSTQISDTLRTYLEERFDFRAPERTTEEFLYELQLTQLLSPNQKNGLADFLSACDLVKFAKYEPAEVELRGLHDSAVRLVNETVPVAVSPAIGSTQLPTAPAAQPPPVIQ